MTELLDIRDLHVTFKTGKGDVKAVDGVSFAVAPGETVALVGESGSGKSVTVGTLMGLTRTAGATFSGEALLRGFDLVSASNKDLRDIRGAEIAMIFQDPMTSLNPVHRVGPQIVEQIRAHEKVSRKAAAARVVELLENVGIPHAAERARSFPHEFSGGMRQRVMIALALSCSPALLIADEPTTALDVTIQAQILMLLRRLVDDLDAGVILVTHDLGVVAEVADWVAVMYAGQIVEKGTLDEIFYDPQHPYTWGLMGSIPRVDSSTRRLASIPGRPPSLKRPPRGCHFRPRCPFRMEACLIQPALEERVAAAPGHADRCHLTPEDKRKLRVVENGRIGLSSKNGSAPER